MPLRPHQIEPAENLVRILRLGSNALDMSDCGVGKCLGPHVQVLMHDGTKKEAKDLVTGDILMGVAGDKQPVLFSNSGCGPMVKIVPNKGEPWECNLEHILVLTATGQIKRHPKGKVIEISVKEFLQLPSKEQIEWKLFSSSGLAFPLAEQKHPPYIYGLWLGDGTVFSGGLTSADREPIRAWIDYFYSIGMRVKKDVYHRPNKASSYTPRVRNRRGDQSNPWIDFVRTSCHGKEKFIKREYLFSSRELRLELLAGLLDSDGYLGNGVFEICSKWAGVASQIAFLARSLGLRVTEKIKTVGGVPYGRLTISGNLALIPTRIPRKKASPRKQIKRHLVVGFKIEKMGDGDFFGVVLGGDRRFLLGDFTVTHNTYVACEVIRRLELPTLVIGPKIAQTAWRNAAEVIGTSLDYCGYEKLRAGNTPYGTWENPLLREEDRTIFKCVNCQQIYNPDDPHACYCNPGGVHCIETKKKAWRYGKFIFASEIKLLIYDEIHRCSGLDSLNADMLIAAKAQRIPTLGLSATAACSPLQLYATGYLLGFHNLKHDRPTQQPDGSFKPMPSFYRWASRYGCRYDPNFRGLKWLVGADRQKEIMVEVRNQIVPSRGVRVSTSDIPDFPKCQITAELYDIEEADKINRLYETMADALAELEGRKAEDKCPDHPLTKILRARQQIELLKVPVMVELAEDYGEKGYSVVCFVNFRQTILELQKRLKCNCIIDGETTGAAREANIERFQVNVERRALVNSDAGGVSLSLHDLHGGFPRVGLVMPCFSAVTFRQLAGRLPRDGGKSPALYRVLFASNTVEQRIHRTLSLRLDNLDCLNDADLQPENLTLQN